MADPWDFAEPVDILPKLPHNFNEQISSAKWGERKEALENLLRLLTDNSRLDPGAHYGEITSKLAKILAKDVNINVCAVAAKCIAGFATGLRNKFQPHAGTFMPIIFDKFKEKKILLRDPLVEAIDAVYKTTNLDAICEAVQVAMAKANPNIKIQTNLFLYRVFKGFTAQTAPKKAIKMLTPLLAKCTGESDPETREAAFSAIGAVMKAVGKPNVVGMIGDVVNDSIKMAQIEKFYEKAVEESAAEAAANAVSHGCVVGAEAVSSNATADIAVGQVEVDPWDFAEPVDILPKLPHNFNEQISSAKWGERKEALENLLRLLTDNSRLDPGAHYGEITSKLAKILAKDANINVCAVAAKCIAGFALGLRTNFQHSDSVVPVIFDKFKEKKILLRDPLVEAIDAVYKTTNLDAICEAVQVAMAKANPNIKIQTNLFLYRVFKGFTAQTAPKKAIKMLTPLLAKCTGESDPETREAAFSAIGAIMRVIGKPNVLGMIGDVANDSIKMAQIEKFYNKVVEELGVADSGVITKAPQRPTVAQSITNEVTKSQVKSAVEKKKLVESLPAKAQKFVGVLDKHESRNQSLKVENRRDGQNVQLIGRFTAPDKPKLVVSKPVATQRNVVPNPQIEKPKAIKTSVHSMPVNERKKPSTAPGNSESRNRSKIPFPSAFFKITLPLNGSRLPVPVSKCT